MKANEKISNNDMENENKKQPDNKRIESTEGNSNKRRNVISGIIKWVIILVILVIVYFWKNDEIKSAFSEMRAFPVVVPFICLAATVLHFVTEGFIIRSMTMFEERQMTWWESFRCGLYCAFIKFASLGSLSGIAEVYYISKHDIDAGRASGITLIQYVCQKLGITILGVVGFISLYLVGVDSVEQYAKWGVLGTVIALLIVAFLLIIATSKKTADLLAFLVKKILGENGLVEKITKHKKSTVKLSSELVEKLYTFNEAGLYFWHHKLLCLKVILMKVLKMSLWYSVAGITVFAAFSDTAFSSGETIPGALIHYFLIPTLLMAVANMIGTVMIAPAGAGTLEFVVSLLFTPLYGVTAVTVVILYRFFSMVIPFLAGSIVFAMDSKK